MNIMLNITATELKQIIEAHLNKTLLGQPGKLANVTMISPTNEPLPQPGQPFTGLAVTFNTVQG